MHQLIASYLFQNKTCPLPGIGNLSVTTTAAKADFSNKMIAAPAPFINFIPDEANAAALLSYVALKTNSNTWEAAEALDHFCDHLKTGFSTDALTRLEGVGDFVVDINGEIKFQQALLPSFFLQPVTAERVIHPQSEHSMLVGDKETTNTLMTEYFNEETKVKDRWWF